jgi:hypothetical protein
LEQWLRQKDKDARWTKKHGKSFYGYKNHVNADARHKLYGPVNSNRPVGATHLGAATRI